MFPPQLLLACSRVGGGVKLSWNEDILDHAIPVSYGPELKVTNVYETAVIHIFIDVDKNYFSSEM